VKLFHHQKFTPDDLVHLRYLAATTHKFNHPNIVNYVGVVTEPSHVCIVQEYMERGSLSTFLQSSANISYEEKVRIAKEIARGMVLYSFLFILLSIYKFSLLTDCAEISERAPGSLLQNSQELEDKQYLFQFQ
jgi:serine/threonine protein kinase